ncbi:hypothetical protein RQP46_002476 [Phenoliferia psychrophenolica]
MLFNPAALLALASAAYGLALPMGGANADQSPVNVDITPRPGALINANIIVGALAPADCSANSFVGVHSIIAAGSLIDLCICLEVIGNTDPNKAACPACPVNSHPVCTTDPEAACGCDCDSGFTKDSDGDCVAPVGPSQRKRTSRQVADIRAAAMYF